MQTSEGARQTKVNSTESNSSYYDACKVYELIVNTKWYWALVRGSLLWLSHRFWSGKPWMISVPIEICGCGSHSMSYGSWISALTSPSVTQLSHLESPCWDKFSSPVQTQRSWQEGCYSAHQTYRLLSRLTFGRTYGLADFPLRAEQFSIESKTVLTGCFLGLHAAEYLHTYSNRAVRSS